MTAFPTLAETFQELSQLARDLDMAVRRLNELDQQRIEAEGAYKVAEARAFRDSEGSMELRKRQSVLECAELWREWQSAEALVKAQQQHLRALHSKIDIHRSCFSAQKAEMAFTTSGGTP
ncbi:putative coiled-coil protein SlyX [Lipingzhangella halophila]|uniref:Putative coiled-coil protein SlyX n=1 Tax=Lipingzhangella halophila TaxID=1783352 RepID=A0A7W7RGY4_9ACTN|nr:hypothetical protein [Lipingzhangella halophila]MBB4931794.1 putative coiled-coil protein SlyX [Lipingzhangella halophila]